MIGYIFLITITIIISTIVYQQLRTYVPTEKVECPEGVSVFLKKVIYDCENKELNITLKNNGRFSVAGYFIAATNKSDQELATIDLSKYNKKEGVGGFVIFNFLRSENSMSPNKEIKSVFDLSSSSSQFYSLNIIPVRYQEIENRNRIVSCGDSRIKETLTCFEKCVPKTCSGLGIVPYICGEWSDGCGGIINCDQPGCDPSTEFCDAEGQCISTICDPDADPSLSGICGIQQCGTADNNTCGAVSCGTCDAAAGFSCNATKQCITICGDNIVGGTEQCDDGNTNNNDDCIIDTNSSYECMKSVCGDGYLWNQGAGGTEQCDDGNNGSGDGCSSTCTIEDGWVCDTDVEPSVCGLIPTIINCADYCFSLGNYSTGFCRQSEAQCGINGETYESGGDIYCEGGGALSDFCCCKP